MKNYRKTLLFTMGVSTLFIVSAILIQQNAQKNLDELCSYLDPIAVDISAFGVAFFLIIEGLHKIITNKNAPLKRQIARGLRMAIGCAILTLHIMQLLHK